MFEKNGVTAISNEVEAVLGMARQGPMERYTISVKIKENLSPALCESVLMPPERATAATPKTGKPIALTAKPIKASTVLVPACAPKRGGNIRFPAPKNIENKVMPTNKQSRLESLFKKITPFKLYISASLK